jgi:hypothetical protein
LELTPDRPLYPRAFDGWALTTSVLLDKARPGFVADTLCADNLTRQVRFAAIAAMQDEEFSAIASRMREADQTACRRESDPLIEIAHALVSLRPRQIVEAVYGSVPDGFLGVMARLGEDPFSPDPGLYRLLWSLFAEPHHRQRATLLMQTEGTITAARVRVLSHLDGILLRRSVLDRLSTPAEVASFREALRLIQSLVPEADDARLGQSLDALGPPVGNHWSRMQGLAVWTLGWLEEMQKAPVAGPFRDNDPDLRLLFGKALLEAGRRYRNCLPKHLGYVAVGRRLYYEWLREPGAIIELNCLRNGQGQGYYSVGQIKGIQNAHLRPEVLSAIRARLIRGGVLFQGATTGQRAPLHSLVNIFEDEDVGDTYVSFLDSLEDAGDEQPIEVA